LIPCLLNWLWTSLAILAAISLAPLLLFVLVPVAEIELDLEEISKDVLALFDL
jgi:cytochrome c oxidase subunit IV